MSNAPIIMGSQKTTINSVVNYTSDPSGTTSSNYSSPTSTTASGSVIVKTQAKALKQITHNGRIIVNIDLKPRSDLNVDSAINRIEILNDQEELFKAFDFEHGYFGSDASTADLNDPNYLMTNLIQEADLRLKLEKINFKDQNDNFINAYSFEYESPENLPRTNSLSQDYYGYYNGSHNTVLYPKTSYQYVTDGANRDVNFDYAKMGMLTKITYPTGGHTVFTYEPNTSNYTTPIERQDYDYFDTLVQLFTHGGQACSSFYCPESECTESDCVGTYMEVGLKGAPNIEHKVFYVDEPGAYKYSLHFNETNTNMAGYPVPHKRVKLFKRNDLNLVAANATPEPLPLSQVFNFAAPSNTFPPDSPINDYKFEIQNTIDVNDESVYLEQGFYQVSIINPEDGASTYFRIGQYKNHLQESGGEDILITKAGIRVAQIEDYTQDGVLALRKNYQYSNGTVISQPIYEYLVSNYTVTEYLSEDVHPPMLHRNSYASGTDKPHIGYEQVTEHITDFLNPDENIRTDHQFNTASWGSHFTGIYSYYVGGKQTARQYGVRYELGKPKSVKHNGFLKAPNPGGPTGYGSKDIVRYEYSNHQYRVNKGLYLRAVESRNHMYPYPKQHPITLNWYVGHAPPRLIPSADSSPSISWLTTGAGSGTTGAVTVSDEFDDNGEDDASGTIYYWDASECITEYTPGYQYLCKPSIGRLDLAFSMAYGKVGYMTKQENFNMQNGIITAFDPELTNSVKTTTQYQYHDNSVEELQYLLESQTTTIGNNSTVKQDFYYPGDFGLINSELINANMLNTPIQTKSYQIDTNFENQTSVINSISTQKTTFNGTLPKAIQTAKGENQLENRILIEAYDSEKNVVQTREPNGTPTTYIWGYDNRYIIAKIENLTYQQVKAYIESLDLVNLSNADDDRTFNYDGKEGKLREKLHQLRAAYLSKAMITTYTHDPMIGLTSMTDPRGYVIYYQYDDAHRHTKVIDDEGKIISENKYNYRPQN